ncbi:hypothetical protein [Nocardia albiluteola]|uniref:hypothetical protein n=1 Tax=Nocardia albiluteola TaxID=2842303 RepID=UPI0027E09801|nr:hypothetical protein [Nocardia albiluteola]
MTPLGEITAIPLRGAWTGNRGIIHKGHEIVRLHGGDLWITCGLEFNGRHVEQWKPHRRTWLFFYDEAVSFAAGHRPCGECRHRDYTAFKNAWPRESGDEGPPSARQMNRRLHAERMIKGTRRRRLHDLEWHTLPNGAFVLHDRTPALVLDSELIEWTERGYENRWPRPARGQAEVITPPAILAILRAGYRAQIDESAVSR